MSNTCLNNIQTMFPSTSGDEHFFARRCIWVNGPVIVGADPSGLAVGAGLKKQGLPFITLERANCFASIWQNRTYDRLKLHLPKQFCQLPNFPFPVYPTKYQFIDYLESYARHFDINPHFNETVQSAKYDVTYGLWRVKTISTSGSSPAEVEYICRWLVVATGENAEKYGLKRPSVGLLELKNAAGKTPVLDGGALEKIRSGDIKIVPGIKRFSRGKVELVNGANLEIDSAILGMGYRSNVPSWQQLWRFDYIEKYGLKRPSVGPLELCFGKTPVLDIGALEKIRSGDIKIVPGIKRFSRGKVDRSNVPSWPKMKGPIAQLLGILALVICILGMAPRVTASCLLRGGTCPDLERCSEICTACASFGQVKVKAQPIWNPVPGGAYECICFFPSDNGPNPCNRRLPPKCHPPLD